MLVEEQIHVRRERAPDAIKKIVSRPRKGAYGDYEVQSASGKKYRVAMRGPGVFENYCSCPDFAVNLKIGFERLHGGVASAKRGKLLERFRKDADCKVFLSTDAGGVGLNLQAASAVIPRLSKDL